MEADIAEAGVADVAERADDSVDEGLGADEAVIGEEIGAVGEMLAGAEADLEMERASSTRAAWPARSLWPWRRP